MLHKNTKILDHAKPPALKGDRKSGQMETVTYSLWPIPYLSPKAQLKTNPNTPLHEKETESVRGVLAFGSSLNFPGRWLLLISIYKFPAEPRRVK